MRLALQCGWLLIGVVVAACADNPAPRDLAIWRVVDAGCNRASGPAPGLQCEPARHAAVLKDRCGATHFLLIPTVRRSGIESDELLQPGEPNYFQAAWDARGKTLAAAHDAGLGDDDIGLAINSRDARSQAQLHIHIDLLQPDLRAALQAVGRSANGAQLDWHGHIYRVDHVADLTRSPFVVVADATGLHDADARAHLSIAVVDDRAGGFYILSDRTDWLQLHRAHAEELLVDRSCN